MASKSVKICLSVLVLIGAAGLSFLLVVAIGGEVVRREDRSDKIAKMVVLGTVSGTNAEADARYLVENYRKFLRVPNLDFEFAYQNIIDTRKQMEIIMLQLGALAEDDLSVKQVPEELHNRDFVYDKLFTSLSPEGTNEDPETETVVQQFTLIIVDKSIVDDVVRQLATVSVGSVRMLTFEAWPAEVKIRYLQSDEDVFKVLKTFDRLETVRGKLCPGSEPHENICSWS